MLITDGRIKNVVALSDHPLKSETLGPARACTRVSLFDWNVKPTEGQRNAALSDVLVWLTAAKPTVILSFSSFSIEPNESDTLHWRIFQAPSSHKDMRWAFYDWHGTHVVPVHGFSPYTKELVKYVNAQVIERAMCVGNGTQRVLIPKPRYEDLGVMHEFYCEDSGPVAVDIESIEGTAQITAVGISNGYVNMSVPFDGYKPYGHEELEPGGTPEQLSALKEVLASDIPKVFHNHTFDVPRLELRGFSVNGAIHDTFCAMAIAYPELPHGLQSSCAALLAVPPWKSLWHPKLPGITKEDIEFWICDPVGLRKYNAEDAFYTWHLARVLLPQVGVVL